MDIKARVVSYIYRAPRLRWLSNTVSRVVINHFATRTHPRPRAFSLWSEHAVPADGETPAPVTDYTSWPALTDRAYSGRHLPPASAAYTAALPKLPARRELRGGLGDVVQLFMRNGKDMETSRSSLLFMFFAQWFTDSLLRTHPDDRRKNTSNHDIDLCQIYGLSEKHCRALRAMRGGKLRSQMAGACKEELPDYLCEQSGPREGQIKERYAEFVPAKVVADMMALAPERRRKLYATGLERGNSSVGYVAISTLFLREHNRLCEELQQKHGDWDDERLFQTARNINTVLLIKLVLEEYINHIMGFPCFRLDTSFAERRPWYRANWMSLEFDLLYRWHGMVPDAFHVQGDSYGQEQYRNNNALLESVGLEQLLSDVSTQAAGHAGLFNAPDFLGIAQYEALRMARDSRLGSYAQYRDHFRLPKMTSFEELTSDERVRTKLKQLYGSFDQLELVVGLFAEQPSPGALFGSLMVTMVAYDAFTQIFSNPLLSCRVYNAATFSAYGLQQIEETLSLSQFAARNTSPRCVASFDVSAPVMSTRKPATQVDKLPLAAE